MLKVGLFLALCALCHGFLTPHNILEFTRFNGKRADPCHIGLSTASPDCHFNQLPDSAVTVLAPAMSSSKVGSITQLQAGTQTVTVYGHNLKAGTVAQFALSSVGGRCSSIGSTAVPATVGTTTASFTVPASWLDTAMELENGPRALCFAPSAATTATTATTTGWVYTGFKWKVVWACNVDNNNQQCPPPSSSTDPKVQSINVGAGAAYDQAPNNGSRIAQRAAMTKCCVTTTGVEWKVNQCVNPNFQSCCGGAAYQPTRERCCSTTNEMTQWYDAPCPCWRSTAAEDCRNVAETCCLPTKYPELNKTTHATEKGQCYNATSHQCCDTGRRFDPGSEQCCVVNGVQTLDVACPCATDAHCVGDWANTADDSNYICCRQTSPVPWESAFESRATAGGVVSNICDKYTNYPNGTGHYMYQPCLGNCINTQMQICCNGVACVKSTESCCNSTCCNKFIGTCARGRRAASMGHWNNWVDYGTDFDVCSTVEQMNTIKAFWVFILPIELLFATIVCLAICLAFAARAKDTHAYSITERVMVGAACLTIAFAVTLFFAPLYKYGVFVVLGSLFAIITAAARVRAINIVCIIFQILLLMYLFDPMTGNSFLTTASNRTEAGFADGETMGILHATARLYKSEADVKSLKHCVNYYKYFQFDPVVRDYERYDNPNVTTFGYCARAWIVALYLFEGAILALVLLQLIVDILALLIRFKEHLLDPVELEMRGKSPEYDY
eukprot:NODE_32_length_2451_cov_722.433805_g27_i0.p1 GENE.NODE_32_length_2451_cov_722.433805_g27_i0~~NODE_32_length_2451_cov_722.433805_g27_i0.p1  ORF type:complete len:728 (-),score=321.92 NODE_32_length_2451_cov_722.433805_g27_i0:194-2377(-)